MKSIVIKIAKWIIGTFFLLFLIGFVSEQAFRIYFDSKKPAEDEFRKVGNREIYVQKQGKGGPTIIFEPGMGGDHTYWTEIQDELSKRTTTLSYDRAGILWSDPVDLKSLKTISNDLFQVLEKTQCPKPYILVGHSLAGITLRRFIKKHSDDIAEIFFIDVSHPLQLKKSSKKLMSSIKAPPKWIISFLNEIGAIRMMYSFNAFTHDVPKDHLFNTHVRDYFYKIYDGLFQEMESNDLLFEQAEDIDDFGTIPLTILTATYPNGMDMINDPLLEAEYLSIHSELQKQLLELSPNSKQIFAKRSGHHILLQELELVIGILKKMLHKNENNSDYE
ncbi:MAG: alpha/beta fold hydrolase [Psychroflexus halocasei]